MEDAAYVNATFQHESMRAFREVVCAAVWNGAHQALAFFCRRKQQVVSTSNDGSGDLDVAKARVDNASGRAAVLDAVTDGFGRQEVVEEVHLQEQGERFIWYLQKLVGVLQLLKPIHIVASDTSKRKTDWVTKNGRKCVRQCPVNFRRELRQRLGRSAPDTTVEGARGVDKNKAVNELAGVLSNRHCEEGAKAFAKEVEDRFGVRRERFLLLNAFGEVGGEEGGEFVKRGAVVSWKCERFEAEGAGKGG